MPPARFVLIVLTAFAACGVMIAGALLAASGWTPGLLPLFAVPVAAGHGMLRLAKSRG
jgi:CHASE2 domain-containing sensor protein